MNIKIKTLFVLFLTIFCLEGKTQSTFQKIYRNAFIAKDIQQTFDHGYVISGLGINSGSLGILRTDSIGTIMWSKYYSSPLGNEASSIIQTPDSGFVSVGGSYGTSTNNLVTEIVKVDKNGAIQWQNAIAGGGTGEKYIIGNTSDGNYFVIGTSLLTNVFCAKIDNSGNLIFGKMCSASGVDMYTHGAIQTTDGGFLIGGTTNYGSISDTSESFLLKLDNSGNFSWGKFYRDSISIFDIVQNGSGYFAIGHDFYNKIGLFKFDSIGNIQWSKTYSGNKPIIATSILKTSENKYLISGGYDSLGGWNSRHYLLMEIDSTGNLNWAKTYGSAVGQTNLRAITSTADNGIALIGDESQSIFWNSFGNTYFIKADSLGNSGCHESIANISSVYYNIASPIPFSLTTNNITLLQISLTTTTFTLQVDDACLYNSTGSLEQVSEISIYPNPFNSFTTLMSSKEINEGKFELFDLMGRIVDEISIINRRTIIIDRNNLPSGIYFWKLSDKNEILSTGKIIIE